MRKRVTLLSVMLLLVSAALCACGGGKNAESSDAVDNSSQTQGGSAAGQTESLAGATSSGEPVQGGSVVMGMTQDLVSLDPHQITDAGTRGVVFNLYEGLVKPTSDGGTEPAVASDYVISEDAKTYTFTLREGVTFHDGSAVTAEDVKYSIDRYAELQGDSSAFSDYLDSVEIADEGTVVLHLKEAYSELLPEVASASIIPEANADPEGNPIGTGPFKFVSYSPGQSLELARFEDYRKDGVPYLDSVTFKFIADADTAYTELVAGTIDILNYLTADKVETLSDDFNVVRGSMKYVHAMFLNNDYEPLRNVKVRQALCCAVDRQAINDFLFDGQSQLIGTHMLPVFSKYYAEDTLDTYSYDPERAKSLLAEAGYADGFDLTITVPANYQQHVDTAQIIAEQLNAVGIRATIDTVEWETWLNDVYNGRQYEATITAWDTQRVTPGAWLAPYCSDNGKNFTNFSSADYDKTYAEAYASIDDDEKAELYKECQRILAENAASVYIEDPADFVAVKSCLGGYTFYPVSVQDMAAIYYTE